MNKALFDSKGFGQMRRHEVLAAAIGKKSIEVAEELGISPERVRQWMREPLGDDSPTGTGRKSPLDSFIALFDAIALCTDDGADTLEDYVRWRKQYHRRKAATMTQKELLQHFQKLRAELNQTIQALETQETARVAALNGHR